MTLIDIPIVRGSGTVDITIQVSHIVSIEPSENGYSLIRTTNGATLFTVPLPLLTLKNKLLALNVVEQKEDNTNTTKPTQATQKIEITMSNNQVVFTKMQIVLFLITMITLVGVLFFIIFKKEFV